MKSLKHGNYYLLHNQNHKFSIFFLRAMVPFAFEMSEIMKCEKYAILSKENSRMNRFSFRLHVIGVRDYTVTYQQFASVYTGKK